MTRQKNLLDKYYKGETNLEEEKELKILFAEDKMQVPETDIFAFYEEEANIPAGLEEDLFAGIYEKTGKKNTIRMRIYSAVSIAAMFVIIVSVYLDFRSKQRSQMEDNFFVMEQALFQISNSLQPPQEQDDMLVLWVDDDVEIIIN